MRIVADLKSLVVPPYLPDITEVQRTTDPGRFDPTAINGRFVIPVPRGVEFDVREGWDHVLPVDGGDVSSIAYAHLLAMYPMFEHLYFNPLLTATDLEDFDLLALFKDSLNASPTHLPVYYPTRAQMGRVAGGPLPAGQAPMMTAILPLNRATRPARPGVLITREITLPLGPDEQPIQTDRFMAYWKVYGFDVTDDISASTGGAQGNSPCVRYLKEVEQEGQTTSITVWLTPDDGANWYKVGLLEPLHLCKLTSKFRLAFVNGSDSKVYLSTFALLF